MGRFAKRAKGVANYKGFSSQDMDVRLKRELTIKVDSQPPQQTSRFLHYVYSSCDLGACLYRVVFYTSCKVDQF